MESFEVMVRMPASNNIDLKDRIMGNDISAIVKRKRSVHTLTEIWDIGNYGKRDTDCPLLLYLASCTIDIKHVD